MEVKNLYYFVVSDVKLVLPLVTTRGVEDISLVKLCIEKVDGISEECQVEILTFLLGLVRPVKLGYVHKK